MHFLNQNPILKHEEQEIKEKPIKKTLQISVITNNRIDENFNHNYCTRDQDHASHLNQNPNLNQESSALNPACNKGLIYMFFNKRNNARMM